MKTRKQLDAKKKEMAKEISCFMIPYLEQFEREFECQVTTVDIVRIESFGNDKDSVLLGIELNVKR